MNKDMYTYAGKLGLQFLILYRGQRENHDNKDFESLEAMKDKDFFNYYFYFYMRGTREC